jgi:Flavin containing amine oxidoreductase
VTAAVDIGFGNVVRILLRFGAQWWADHGGQNLADLSFLFSNATVPTWWTQHPAEYPALTGWFAGPKADKVARFTETELIGVALASARRDFQCVSERHNETSRCVASD